MIKTSKLQIETMKLVPNRVLVKVHRMPDELVLNEDIKLYIDHTFAHEQHTTTTGVVVNHCGELNTKKLNWLTKNELEVGDNVVFNYVAGYYCLNEDSSRLFIDEEKNVYFMLDYEDFFIAKRDGKIIPLNGYVLCNPIKDEIKASIAIPDFIKKKKSNKYGVVKFIGSRNEQYFLIGENGQKVREDLYDFKDGQIKVGDIVVFDKHCDLPIEHEMHQSAEGRKAEPLYRMQRCNISAVIEKEFAEEVGISI